MELQSYNLYFSPCDPHQRHLQKTHETAEALIAAGSGTALQNTLDLQAGEQENIYGSA